MADSKKHNGKMVLIQHTIGDTLYKKYLNFEIPV